MSKLLIVEDDQITGNIYRNKFCIEGYEVEIATDGETGLDIVERFRPDVVILDLVLPKMAGAEVIRRIRALPDFQQTPIIVFSNTYLPRMIQEAWQAGATKCLSKTNCTPREVVEVVRKTLGPPRPPSGVPPGPPPKAPVPAKPRSDGEFQDQVRKAFLDTLPATNTALRTALQAGIKTESPGLRLKHLGELHRQIHALTNSAGVAGAIGIAQMSGAAEALLRELYEKPKNINPSTLRTVASAIDFLSLLFQRTTVTEEPRTMGSQILVVDDEAISRRAVSHALQKADLTSITAADPQIACALLEENRFDLIFLDVEMPGMTGFELCSKLRAMPAHQKTPVVFVTVLNDFENRAASTISGGNDLIGKPFLFIELAVKALVYVMRGRLEPKAAPAQPASIPGPDPALK